MPSGKSRFTLLAAAGTMTLLLAACSPGALAPAPSAPVPSVPTPTASTSQTPSPTPTASSTPTATASPSPAVVTPSETSEPVAVGPHVPAGWEEYEVDGWATVYAPAGWSVRPVSDHPDEPSQNLVNADGKTQLNFMYEAPGGYPITPETCGDPNFQLPPFTLLEATPMPWAMEGEELHHALTIREVQVYAGEQDREAVSKFQVASRLAEADRYVGTACEPFSAIYPDAGGYLWVTQQGDPIESVFFDTKEQALEYTTSDEYELVKQVIETVQLSLED